MEAAPDSGPGSPTRDAASPPPPPLPSASDKRAMVLQRAGLADTIDALFDGSQPAHVVRAFLDECRERAQPACDADEPLLRETPGKYVVFPLDPRHYPTWAFYKQHVANFWTAEEIDFASDQEDWARPGYMTDAERTYVKLQLAFFAASDGIVCENLIERFCTDVQSTEVRMFYGFQAAMENIHGETYSLMIDTLVAEPAERARLLNAIDTMPCIGKKARWALDWIGGGNATRSFAERLVAFTFVEGVFFSSAFCAIYWLRSRGLLEGVVKANELIARDEGLHCQFAAYLYRDHIVHKLPRARVLEILAEAVEHECEFVRAALPTRLNGINADAVLSYVRYVADYTLGLLGFEPHYGDAMPFDWMHAIAMDGKSNFFEQRVSEYQRPGIMAGATRLVAAADARGELSEGARARLRQILKTSSSSAASSASPSPATSRTTSLASSTAAVGRGGASGENGEVVATMAGGDNDDDIDF